MIKYLDLKKKYKTILFSRQKIVGEVIYSKISKVVNFLKIKKQIIVYFAPENVAWLLNIRGYDNPNSPIPNARLILNKKKNFFNSK